MIIQTQNYALFNVNNTAFRLDNLVLFGPNMSRGMLSVVLTFTMKYEFTFEPDSIYIGVVSNTNQ